MKKNIIITAMLTIPLCLAFADQGPYPEAKKGINIWPAEKVNEPVKDKAKQSMMTIKANGYSEETDTDESVKALFEIPNKARQETEINDKNENPLDTHLRSNLSKIKLSFKFTGIPDIKKEKVFGFSPAGGYTHKNGWDGIVEFVDIPTVGICSFTTFAIDSVILYKETVEYLVNKKPSDKYIAGNRTTGYLYVLNWYTDNRRNSLECANKELKPENMKNIIFLAKKIDSSMN